MNAACKDNDIKEIAKCLNSESKYELRKDLSLIALQGPKAETILETIIKGVKELKFMNGNYFKFLEKKIYITRSGYTGEDGFEISVPNVIVENLIKLLTDKDAKPIGLGARDTLRLEAGLCLYGHELNQEINPIQANLKWAISKKEEKQEDSKAGKILKKIYKTEFLKLELALNQQVKLSQGRVQKFILILVRK